MVLGVFHLYTNLEFVRKERVMNARVIRAVVLSFVLGSLAMANKASAQASGFAWHFILTDAGRNYWILGEAQSYPDGAYGGQCKSWVQQVVWEASDYNVWLPQNSPGCDWQWNWSPNVQAIASDRWDGFPLLAGQIIQAQVRYSQWPYTSPHTMIVVNANAQNITVIESNYSSPLRVQRRTVSWNDFRRDVIHYTLYQVK
jgi:hypothetical protein